MAKNRNTAAKRSREAEKRRKAQDKIDRRRERKASGPASPFDRAIPPVSDESSLT